MSTRFEQKLDKVLNEDLGQIDRDFDELLSAAKDHMMPEAIATMIEQAKMIRERLRKEREMDNWHRLKLRLLEQIQELRAVFAKDPESQAFFEDWIEKYISNKEAALSEAEGLKDTIEDYVAEVQMTYTEMSIPIGTLSTALGVRDLAKGILKDISYAQKLKSSAAGEGAYGGGMGDVIQVADWLDANLSGSGGAGAGMATWIADMNGRLDGYDWVETGAGKTDITGFINVIQRIIQEGAQAAAHNAGYSTRKGFPARNAAKESERMTAAVRELSSLTKAIIGQVKETKKIMNTARAVYERTQFAMTKQLHV